MRGDWRLQKGWPRMPGKKQWLIFGLSVPPWLARRDHFRIKPRWTNLGRLSLKNLKNRFAKLDVILPLKRRCTCHAINGCSILIWHGKAAPALFLRIFPRVLLLPPIFPSRNKKSNDELTDWLKWFGWINGIWLSQTNTKNWKRNLVMSTFPAYVLKCNNIKQRLAICNKHVLNSIMHGWPSGNTECDTVIKIATSGLETPRWWPIWTLAEPQMLPTAWRSSRIFGLRYGIETLTGRDLSHSVSHTCSPESLRYIRNWQLRKFNRSCPSARAKLQVWMDGTDQRPPFCHRLLLRSSKSILRCMKNLL